MPESSLSPSLTHLDHPHLSPKKQLGTTKIRPWASHGFPLLALDDGLPIHVSWGPKGQWGKGFRPGWLLKVRMLGNTFVRKGHLCHVTFPILFTTQDMSEDPSKTHPQWAWWIAILIMLMGFLAGPNSCARFLAGGSTHSINWSRFCPSMVSYPPWPKLMLQKTGNPKTWHSSLVLAC